MGASIRKMQAWVKVVVLLLAAALVFCFVSTFALVSQASAKESVEGVTLTEEQINEKITSIFPDANFRAVVAKALDKAGLNQNNQYNNDKNIKETVRSLNCTGLDVSGKSVSSIQGVKYLTGVQGVINFSDNVISDLSPLCLGSTEKYNCSFNVEGNPISKWPNDTFEFPLGEFTYDVIFKTTRNATALNITNSFAFSGIAQYRYGTQNIVQYLNYGVTTGDDYLWREDLEPKLQITSTTGTATMQTEAPAVASRAKVTNILDNVSYLIAANTIGVSAIRACDFINPNYEHQDISYSWSIQSKFFASVTGTVNAKSAGSVTVTKTDSTGTINIPGAVFRLYNSDKTTIAKDVNGVECPDTTTDETGKASWQGIPNGTYYVQEVKAPAGFQRDTDFYEVTVNVQSVEVGSTSFNCEGGETVTTPQGEVNGVMITNTEETWSPDWSKYSSSAQYNPLKTSGSASLVKGIFITNDGNKLTELSITTDLDDDESLTATNTYTITHNGTEISVDADGKPFTAESVLTYVNNLVETSALSGDIVVNRKVIYSGASQGNPDPSVTAVADIPLPLYLTPAILKQVKNDTLVGDDYTFALYDELDTQLEVVTNDKNGLAVFEPLVFENAGTYKYTIRELKPSEYGQTDDDAITYDVTPREMKVVVTEVFGSKDKAGLKAVVSVDGKEVAVLYSSQTTTYDKAGQIVMVPSDPIQVAKITNKKTVNPFVPGTGDSFPVVPVVILVIAVALVGVYVFRRRMSASA